LTNTDLYENKVINYFEKTLGRSLLRLAIVILLDKTTYHGYGIYKVIKNKLYRNLSLSTLYTVLHELTKLKIIERDNNIYTISLKGKKILEIMRTKYPIIISSLENLLISRINHHQ